MEERTRGFSLIEVLVATVLIAIALAGALGCLAGGVAIQQTARRQADLALEKWNDTRLFRDRPERGEAVRMAPDLPPLWRLVVDGEGSPDWEVLHHD